MLNDGDKDDILETSVEFDDIASHHQVQCKSVLRLTTLTVCLMMGTDGHLLAFITKESGRSCRQR